MTLKIKFPHLFLILIAIAPLQLSAFIEIGREEAKDDPVEEQARDTANNSQEARITAAKNQRSYGSQTIMVEETIDSSNQSHDPQENSHPMNKISSTGETTPSLPENEHPLSHSSASAAALEGVPVSETQNEGRTHFRLTQNGWEKRRRDANGVFLGDWEQASVRSYVRRTNPEELQRFALASFGEAYNRADSIACKKSLYERELKSLQSSSDRAQFLTKLIPLFDQAIVYQNDIVGRLRPRDEEYEGTRSENPEERVAAESQAAQREFVRLQNIMKINSRPNQVERLIEQIEKEEAERLDAQKQLAQVEDRLTVPDQTEGTRSSLNEAAANFRRAIAAYPELIQARLDSARLIQAPYKKSEEIDLSIQDEIKASKKALLKKESLAQLSYRLGKCNHARALGHGTSMDREYRFLFLVKQHDCLVRARRELERDQPRQAVIDLCFRAADCYERAAAVFGSQNDGQSIGNPATYLNNAGDSLVESAKETQKDQPRQAAIDYYLRAADCYERAVAAFGNPKDPNRLFRTVYLNNAGGSLFQVAKETQKDQPRQAAIDYYLRAADFHERAAATFNNPKDPNRVIRAKSLNNAGGSLFRIAQETQKEEPRQAAIDYYLRAVDANTGAIAALDDQKDPDSVLRAKSLNNAALSLYRAASEAQEATPDKAEIDKLLQEALEWEAKAQALPTTETWTTEAASIIN